MKCRHCGNEVTLPFIDLGTVPPSNAFLTAEQLSMPEKSYPLRVLVCEHCWLVQTEDFADAEELFLPDYAYFSSYSNSWLRQVEEFVNEAIRRFELQRTSLMVEIAANDGYLLQYAQRQGIPCYGVEPTAGTAAAARARGIEIVEAFFGRRLAGELVASKGQADLIVANNVLAHVPDINDFVAGFAMLLKPSGVATFEFPHLLRLVAENQFDTIYHEHFSYLSLTVVQRVLEANGLHVFDVEEYPTHGGSLRVFSQRADPCLRARQPRVDELLRREETVGVETRAYYNGFQERAWRIRSELLSFLLQAREREKKVVAYGAAAKGNTMLNFARVRSDLVSFVVDRNPAKQQKYLPGSRIPIVDESLLRQTQPDYVLLLPWNLEQELTAQLDYVRCWGGQFVTAVPELRVT